MLSVARKLCFDNFAFMAKFGAEVKGDGKLAAKLFPIVLGEGWELGIDEQPLRTEA